MIDRRLTRLIGESRKYIILNVLMQWISLCANIVMMYGLSVFLSALFQGIYHASFLILFLMTALGALFIRYLCTRGSRYMSYRSSATVKSVLREKIFRKLLKLGPAYQEMANTAELIQTAVEGVDQLETYFGMYLPQFFYAMLAPLTLFAVLAFVDLTAAFVLLRALRYEEADRELLLRVARFLLRRGDALSFNVASLMRLSFGLDELRGTFSLQLQPWQLDKMEQDWAYFSRQMNF